MAIFITGDTHGDFSRLLPAAFHEQRDLTKEDYLILCGDFGGVWDGGDAEQQWLDWLETRSFTTLFVSGNLPDLICGVITLLNLLFLCVRPRAVARTEIPRRL